MRIYAYVYVYIYMCIGVCVYIYIYIFIYIFRHVNPYERLRTEEMIDEMWTALERESERAGSKLSQHFEESI